MTDDQDDDTRGQLDQIRREKAEADYWKRIALEDRQAENDRRARLGLKPLPLPESLTE